MRTGEQDNPAALTQSAHPMTLHVSTLSIMAVAMLALSAGVLTAVGMRGRVYPGHWWWAAAQWALAAGVLLGALANEAGTGSVGTQVLAQVLVLQWPVALLAGLRGFYARREWRVDARVDIGLFVVGVVCLIVAANPAGASARSFDPSALRAAPLCVLHLYAAWLVTELPDFRKGAAIKVFAAMALAGALLPGWQFAQSLSEGLGAADDATQLAQLAQALVNGAMAMAMVYGVPLLAGERTENNLRMAHRQLRFLADMDVLTGVPNRRHFHERAAATLGTASGLPICVLMFDIDHFKQINDRLGHAVGDEALRQVARCTRDSLRELDVAGRLGGDEFAVLLPDTSLDDAMSVASRIVAQLEHRQVAPRVAWLSLSFGVVQLHAEEDVDSALRRADQALYEAKRQGRGRAVAASGYEDDPVFGESRPLGLTAH